MEFVSNPVNPTENCFPDTQFSVSHGRFWSSIACDVKFDEIPDPPFIDEIIVGSDENNAPPAPPPDGRVVFAPAPPSKS